MEEITGVGTTDDEWHAQCPYCNDMIDFAGFYDPDDVIDCPRCNSKFKVVKVYFEDDSYMGR